jgi:hypothetical protein
MTDINELIEEQVKAYIKDTFEEQLKGLTYNFFTDNKNFTVDIVKEVLTNLMTESSVIQYCVKRVIQDLTEKELQSKIQIIIKE